LTGYLCLQISDISNRALMDVRHGWHCDRETFCSHVFVEFVRRTAQCSEATG
jgi:hypothetical protein